jgi:hypothetical protein
MILIQRETVQCCAIVCGHAWLASGPTVLPRGALARSLVRGGGIRSRTSTLHVTGLPTRKKGRGESRRGLESRSPLRSRDLGRSVGAGDGRGGLRVHARAEAEPNVSWRL